MKHTLILAVILTVSAESERRRRRETSQCEQRCVRLQQRSMQRMGADATDLLTLIDDPHSTDRATQACWKFYDHQDCMQHCDVANRAQWKRSSRTAKAKCNPLLEGNESNFACISKFHSFLEVRCSGYMDKALRIHSASARDPSLEQETCRYLYYHSLCLVNNVVHFCPASKKIFTRLNLRDYFLSFVLPGDPNAFSEEFLDYCQLYDFVKVVEDVDTTSSDRRFQASTKSTSQAEVLHSAAIIPDEQLRSTKETTTPSDYMRVNEDSSSPDAIVVPSTESTSTKKLFAPERDLLNTPPNFFYSSQRYGLAHQPTQYPSYYTTEHSAEVVTLMPIFRAHSSTETMESEESSAEGWTDDSESSERSREEEPTSSTVDEHTNPITAGAPHAAWTQPRPTVLTNSGEIAYVLHPDRQLQNESSQERVEEVQRKSMPSLTTITAHFPDASEEQNVAGGAIVAMKSTESAKESSTEYYSEELTDERSKESTNPADVTVNHGESTEYDEHRSGEVTASHRSADPYDFNEDVADNRAETYKPSSYENGASVSFATGGERIHGKSDGKGDYTTESYEDLHTDKFSNGIENGISATSSREINKSKTRNSPLLTGHRVHVKPIRSWKDSYNTRSVEATEEELSAERSTEYSRSAEGEPRKENSEAWDDVYDISPNANIDQDTTALDVEDTFPSEDGRTYDFPSRIHSYATEHESQTVAGKSTEDKENDHHAVMIIVYGILVSVAFITVIALLIAIAIRKHLS